MTAISVVIPLFNKAPHIIETLESVLAQTSPPDEIIVVDDASTDNGPALIRALANAKIRLIPRCGGGRGPSGARNLGILESRSEWVSLLDADDLWRPGMIAEVRSLIEGADSSVATVFTGYVSRYADGRERPDGITAASIAERGRLSFDEFIELWLSIGKSPMWTSAVTARRSSLIACGLFPEDANRGEDKDTWLRLLHSADAIFCRSDAAIYRRDATNMLTQTVGTNHRPYFCDTLEKIEREGPPDRAKQVRRLMNWEMFCYARDCWRSGLRINQEMFRGFAAREDPAIYALLSAASGSPDWLWNASRAVRKMRSSKRI